MYSVCPIYEFRSSFDKYKKKQYALLSCHLNFKVNLYFVIKHIKGIVMPTPLLRIPFPGGVGLLLIWQTLAQPPSLLSTCCLLLLSDRRMVASACPGLKGFNDPVPLSQAVITLAHLKSFIFATRR